MSDHIRATIADLQEQLRKYEQKVSDTKRLINMLCESASMPLVYPEQGEATSGPAMSMRRDQFYGKGISTAMREYLDMRAAANLGPATVNEIHQALTDGGFKFDAKDDANAKRGIRISLTKNTSIFHRLPDRKHFGLNKWYPDVKENGKPLDSAGSKDKATIDEGGDDDG